MPKATNINSFQVCLRRFNNSSKAGRSILHHQNICSQNRILHITLYKLFCLTKCPAYSYIEIIFQTKSNVLIFKANFIDEALSYRHEGKLDDNLCLHQSLVLYSHTNNRKHVIVIQSFSICTIDSFTQIKGVVCTSDFVYLCIS